MSVRLDSVLLAYDLAVRGVSPLKFAKKIGLSAATMSTALSGKPIAEASAMLIADGLDAIPVVEALVRLISPPVRPLNSDQPPDPPMGLV
jgi:predicted N-formylglutamate amidohydrolase